MTTPGGPSNITPGDWSASADSSIPGLKGRTQTSVSNTLKSDVASSSNWGGASNTFFGTLFGGFIQGITGFISALVYGLKGITGGLIDLTGALKATDQKADTAINTATGAAQTVVNVQKEIIQKIAVFDIKSPTPLYVALNRTEWPSIGWSDAMSQGLTSDLNTVSNQLTATQQRFAFIVVPVDTALSGLNFYARGTPTSLKTRVYLMAPTGDLTALGPESGNLASLLVSNFYTATPANFPEDVIVEAGSIVAVRFASVGNVWLLSAEVGVVEPPSGFYPKHIRATTSLASGTAAPDFIAEASLSWAATTGSGYNVRTLVPYVAVGNNIIVPQPKRFFEDNFDRADSGGVGNSWSSSLSVGIRSNELAFTSTTDGRGVAVYTKPLVTDYQLHGCRVGLLPDPADSQVAFSALLFRCTQNRSTGLRVAFRRGSIILQSIANQTTFTNLVSTTRTLTVGDSIQAQQGEWVGEVFYPDRVLVFHNGIEIIRTDVTSSTVPYGPQRRYGGLGQERTPFQNSPRIQDWFESDISDVEAA